MFCVFPFLFLCSIIHLLHSSIIGASRSSNVVNQSSPDPGHLPWPTRLPSRAGQPHRHHHGRQWHLRPLHAPGPGGQPAAVEKDLLSQSSTTCRRARRLALQRHSHPPGFLQGTGRDRSGVEGAWGDCVRIFSSSLFFPLPSPAFEEGFFFLHRLCFFSPIPLFFFPLHTLCWWRAGVIRSRILRGEGKGER